MKTLPKSSEPTGIDMSPLIDMVFILLIFFMVCYQITNHCRIAFYSLFLTVCF